MRQSRTSLLSRMLSIAAVVAVMVGQCFAATVMNNAGANTTPGSLGYIVNAQHPTGNITINFADTVKEITLSHTVTSDPTGTNFTLIGRPDGFDAAVTDLIADILAHPEQYSGNALTQSLTTLSLPGVTIDGEDTWRLFAFGPDYDPFSTSGPGTGTTALSGLVLRHAGVDTVGNNLDDLTNTSAKEYGGAVYIGEKGKLTSVAVLDNSLSATGGTAEGNSSGSKANANADANGGGAFIWGGGTITSSIFSGNSATATGGNATGGSNVTATTFANADADADAYAYGGGAAILGKGRITTSVFSNNSAIATGDSATGGSNVTATFASASASASARASAYGGGASIMEEGTITTSVFSNNLATAKGGSATGGMDVTVTSNAEFDRADAYAYVYAYAYGGGASIMKEGTITTSVFSNNSAIATGGSATGGNTRSKTTVLANADASASASGGGAYLGDVGAIDTSVFSGNSVTATGGSSAMGGSNNGDTTDFNTEVYASAYAYASGGGADIAFRGTISSSLFQGNTVSATGGDTAIGGTGGSDRGVASYTWANADAYAFGGGLYIGRQGLDAGETNTLINTSFLNNSVTAIANGTVEQNDTSYTPVAEARGGAVFVNTSTRIAKLSLEAESGEQSVIAGNTANGRASGIHFGRDYFFRSIGYFADSGLGGNSAATFDVTAHGEIIMADPLTVEMYSKAIAQGSGVGAFAMTVNSGNGLFVWGGTNVLDANGGATVTFKYGSNTVFTTDYTLTTTSDIDYRIGSPNYDNAYALASEHYAGTVRNPLTVNLEAGSKLAFDFDRDGTLALFDFGNSTLGTFTVSAGAELGMNFDRQLLSIDGGFRYLVASGITDADRDGAAANFTAASGVKEFDASLSGQLWAISDAYHSPYQATIDQWNNLTNAAPSLQALLADRVLVSQEQFDAVVAHLSSATPDSAATLFGSLPSQTAWLADNVVRQAFADTKAALCPVGGYRLWGGYIGNFDRADSHSGSHGYRQNVNGFLSGVNRDFASGSVGVYLGYTRGNTWLRGSNGRATADGYHVGLVGQLSPLAVIAPGLSVTVDAGFSYYDADSRRFDGTGRISGDFSQRAWTAGLEAEYTIPLWCRTLLTPFVAARYGYYTQSGFTEYGGLTSTRLSRMHGDSVTTDIGARIAHEVSASWGSVSPFAEAAWRHEYGDRTHSGTGRYVQGVTPGAFGIASYRRDRDSARLGVGVRARRELAQARWLGVTAGYDAGLSANGTSHSLSAMVEFGF